MWFHLNGKQKSIEMHLQFSTKCNVSNLILKLFQLRNEHVKHTQRHKVCTRCQLDPMWCKLYLFVYVFVLKSHLKLSFRIHLWSSFCVHNFEFSFHFISFQLCEANTYAHLSCDPVCRKPVSNYFLNSIKSNWIGHPNESTYRKRFNKILLFILNIICGSNDFWRGIEFGIFRRCYQLAKPVCTDFSRKSIEIL